MKLRHSSIATPAAGQPRGAKSRGLRWKLLLLLVSLALAVALSEIGLRLFYRESLFGIQDEPAAAIL